MLKKDNFFKYTVVMIKKSNKKSNKTITAMFLL